METDYSKHSHFRWKIKWRLEHLGAHGIMGKASPLILTSFRRRLTEFVWVYYARLGIARTLQNNCCSWAATIPVCITVFHDWNKNQPWNQGFCFFWLFQLFLSRNAPESKATRDMELLNMQGWLSRSSTQNKILLAKSVSHSGKFLHFENVVESGAIPKDANSK